jgi:hypothetical protein
MRAESGLLALHVILLQRDISVAFGEADIGGFWRTAIWSRTLKRHAPQLSDKVLRGKLAYC